jgi:hypothetical protein
MINNQCCKKGVIVERNSRKPRIFFFFLIDHNGRSKGAENIEIFNKGNGKQH